MSSQSPAPAIVWFRDDLRLADNPALHAAAASGRPLICLYVQDEVSSGLRPLGAAARWWLSGALEALASSLRAHGGRLLIRHGAAADIVEELALATGAAAIFWNRRYDEGARAVDAHVKAALTARGIYVESCNGALLNEPWTIESRSGAPFRVFSAYWRAACLKAGQSTPLSAPGRLAFYTLPENVVAKAASIADLALTPVAPDWAGGLRETWTCGENAVQARLEEFLAAGLPGYASARDRPDKQATSRLSPYLRFGNISPRQIWHAAHAARDSGRSPVNNADVEKFLSELGWREFSYHVLYHRPDLARRNVQARFDKMAWRNDPAALRAWQRGRTGYPLVDAGMRELWATGWMHNRVRMITASFLTKHLLIDWRDGEAWFWDTLVDADPASNPFGWQWVAGSGFDAAPYFRVFNPVLQGEKFDPDGVYVKRWIPELKHLPAAFVQQPWRAKPRDLAAAGVRLGETYAYPIVDHDVARQRALVNWSATCDN